MRRSAVLMCLLSVTLSISVACGDRAPEAGRTSGEDTGPRSTSYPLTIENCGVNVTFDGPPRRAVSLYQSSTEIMLALGLADRMVGTSTWFDPVLPELAADNATVPRLADNDPGLETVLVVEPDLVTSASAHTFTPAVVADRSRFAQLGIPTYQSPSVCTGARVDGETVTRTEPLTLDTLYREIRELAEIFDVQQRGQDLLDRLLRRLDDVPSSVAPDTSVAFWFSGLRTPYLAGCCSAPGLYATELGVTNVFADAREDWPEVSWEALADRDPDVLVLADLNRRRVDGDALDSKVKFLESNPVTRNMSAVRAKRYVVLTGSELDPGIREIDAVVKLAAGLKAFGLAQ
ncbi:ABC transporter substrate-binding protein [Mycolicibacterium sp. HK-90]|uniref:ABC transporter substrate-binding protein n=1 Tax=Mycolicibacterium sp. HK-90 TaxID=3056937 RepID=UPI002658E114|nr:ABC transporter substrate-binding protein [Mycolicibacterium sp. HK-90]WKG01568.1 ABC transporter substrate-binding protein [Mycolicibacterium sp. HK-90]